VTQTWDFMIFYGKEIVEKVIEKVKTKKEKLFNHKIKLMLYH